MNIVRKTYEAEVKAFDDKELIIEHFISTEDVDRSGDVVKADGMTLDGWPVVLKQHGKDVMIGAEPIAKPLELKIGTNKNGKKGIIAKTKYFPDEIGKRLYEKAKTGYMPYWSIGFGINKAFPNKTGGQDVTSWVLFEYSQVGVPDNVNADVIKAKGLEAGTKPEDIITFAIKAKDETLPAPAVEPPKVSKLKSLAAKVEISNPMACLQNLFYALQEAIFWPSEDEQDVDALLLEFADIATPFVNAIREACKPKDEKGKREMFEKMVSVQPDTKVIDEKIGIVLKSFEEKIKQLQSVAPQAAPVAPESPASASKEPFIRVSAVKESVIKLAADPVEPKITVDVKAIREEVAGAIKSQFNTLTGRLD
jgi:hypothetical protein